MTSQPTTAPTPGPRPSRRTLWLAGGTLAAAFVILGGINGTSGDTGARPAAYPETTQTLFTAPAQTAETPYIYSPAPDPSPTDSTCADSAAWDADGPGQLLDGYISNQRSGNINPDVLREQCPQYLPVWERAKGGISGGALAVPAEAKPGTYETISADLQDCYWERARAGQTVANNFVLASRAKLRVTIRQGDDTFISRGCGNWVRVG